MPPRARVVKERMNKWDNIKLKSFCMAKVKINTMEREPTVWGNILANDNSDKDLIIKIHKKLTQLHTRKTNNSIKNGQRT